ncbi:substrate-binding domain-containing protein [Opitutus sp. GAS368]|uniref:substrate-binding domain-containing protein n=1 Tax=Opitutus sp. GAS368 TaxID=1882749 RepID=UPI0008794A16|nr:substrate-binding domain-containing protein [Opitutus sp. GAS368]SDS48932.1 DNA-binding transcriptional regulator, LacI/PurR family [Opitutus sp. GAS368]
MNSSPLPFEIPKRMSLAAQAADSIKQAITDGTWREYLPSERRLCGMLRVSRPTIRTALRMLSEKGMVEIHQGRRNRLLSQPRQAPKRQSRLIGLVTPEPFTHLAVATYQIISEMRGHLSEQGFTTEVLVCQAQSVRAQRRKLEEFVRHNRVLCCVLLSVSKDLQQWCSENSVPALVLGSCHSEVKLPSLDIDYRSVCRHAGGIFLSKGHRRMALVVPHSGVAGDLASEVGFMESIQLNRQIDARASIVRHNGTAQNISAKLDVLFNSAHAPTALLVAKPQHVFIVILYLLKHGLTVPDTVSFIARDHDHIFETVSPPIAYYSPQDDTFAHRLSRLMLQMVNHGNLEPQPNLIFPKYFPGGTVKQLG